MTEIALDIQGKQSIGLDVAGESSISLGIERSTETSNYAALVNKPSIEGHVLVGDSTLGQIGVGDITPQAIDTIIYG